MVTDEAIVIASGPGDKVTKPIRKEREPRRNKTCEQDDAKASPPPTRTAKPKPMTPGPRQ